MEGNNLYTWGYLKDAALAKLDLTEEEANEQKLLKRFHIYANEVMTQVCSTIKPNRTFAEFTVSDITQLYAMPDDFVAFGNDVCKVSYYTDGKNDYLLENIPENCTVWQVKDTATDEDFEYVGFNKIRFLHQGVYQISYNARWYTFTYDTPDGTILPVPMDILDCIPTYIASQCYKIDDETKSSIYRNEYEMLLARIDNTDYSETKTVHIGGGW